MSDDKQRWLMKFTKDDMIYYRTFDFETEEQRDEYIDMCVKDKGWTLDELWRSERIVNQNYVDTRGQNYNDSWERQIGWE